MHNSQLVRAGRNVVLPNGCLVSVRYIDDDMVIVNIFRGRKLLISDIVDKETIDQFIDSYDYSTQYIHIP